MKVIIKIALWAVKVTNFLIKDIFGGIAKVVSSMLSDLEEWLESKN